MCLHERNVCAYVLVVSVCARVWKRPRERERERETEKAKAINSAQEMSERNFPCKLKFLAKKIKLYLRH